MKRVALILLTLLATLTCRLNATEHKAIIIPVQFSDLEFSHGSDEFSLLADSLKLYFDTQFHGSKTFTFDVAPIVTLSKSYKYYGENSSSLNDALMYKGVAEACNKLDDSIDFSDYDNGSGSSRTVNDIIILVPGMSEVDAGQADLFWPQTLSLVDKDTYLVLDKRRIDHYALATELDCNGNFTGIGDIAHEYSHLLGLKDLYDTDDSGSGGLSPGLWGCTALMDKGNRNGNGHLPPNYNAVDLYTLGIGNGVELTTAGAYSLAPIDKEGKYYIYPSEVDGEVYLIECRKAEGYDALIGGSGMLIYHVDRSENSCGWSDYYKIDLSAAARWTRNQVNCNPDYECARLVAAIPDTDEVGKVFFPQGEVNSISSDTDPAISFRSNSNPIFAITDICLNEDGSCSFNLVKPLVISGSDVFQTSVILSWETDASIDVESCDVLCISGSDTLSVTAGNQTEEGQYSCTIEHLSPNTEYTFIIRAYTAKASYSTTTKVKTRPYRAKVYPFILIRKGDRNSDGTFSKGTKIPLQVFNTPDALEYKWYFNGKPISTAADGYYEIVSSGKLKVEAYREDGSVDIIIKEIIVS